MFLIGKMNSLQSFRGKVLPLGFNDGKFSFMIHYVEINLYYLKYLRSANQSFFAAIGGNFSSCRTYIHQRD